MKTDVINQPHAISLAESALPKHKSSPVERLITLAANHSMTRAVAGALALAVLISAEGSLIGTRKYYGGGPSHESVTGDPPTNWDAEL